MQKASFTQKVRDIVHVIPPGRVATYGQVAKLAGNPKAARAVGQIMSQNKDTKAVPCHRVVASNGRLTGYAFGGVSSKEKILRTEGVAFKGKNIDLKIALWNGKAVC